ncbi:MAG: sodium:proton exchanger [Candidatus Harrisonbacteria bacterium CG10_big_fil_rev_8_21_14_0_10_42_17]|uniref:Sodium:proton exchanger n=1 Tax=Candidatus Harrisonbacteria bacterium CG10_big_fil_rev_8_21_14_0_10_42_17 TaxID=1974584 RepID=A0A2M6WIW3_9BACT|nr:MAG: sodium:proton exchanger [Candidatus Harrisonbacteria bacterium CG10_big_fil_rev_8_21_14_0_10_42_17]
MVLTIFLFAVGFIFLIKGANLLVDGSSSIGKILGIPNLIIGLTIVAIGTSAPELFVNIIASIQGNGDIAIGNILGSNISNILLILGIAAIITPLEVHRDSVWRDIPFSLLAILVTGFLVNDVLIDGKAISELSRIDGLILLSFFAVFMYYTFSIAKGGNRGTDPIEKFGIPKSLLLIGIGLIGLALGAKWVVDGGVIIAETIGFSETFIGLTLIAFGTSLPELVTVIVAARKGQTDLAIGNIVGSNIFNLFWVLGFSSVISPLTFKPETNSDIGMVIYASLLLFLSLFVGRRHIIERWQGIFFLIMYGGYITFLITQGYNPS